MERHPRDPKEKLLTGKLLTKRVMQGLIAFAASFGACFVTLANDPANAFVARAMGLAAASVLWYELVKLGGKITGVCAKKMNINI